MNTYEVRGKTENGTNLNHKCTEANEAAARKAFRSAYREAGCKVTIDSVELVAENQLATKQQEREALASIRQIVEALGPQSYLATAFEGCFEDAENNIEDDAAYSMKARYESEQEELRLAKDALSAQNKAVESLLAELDFIKSALAEAKGKVLSADDLTDVSQLLSGKVFELGKEVSNAANRIVEAAGQPDSAAFLNAVKDHRAAKTDMDYFTALLVRVNNLSNAGA